MTGSLPREPRRTPLTGSTFVRTLASLGGGQASAPQHDAYAQRLSRWFDWTHAIALSAALSDAPLPPRGPGGIAPTPALADEHECARVRAALVALINDATAGPTTAGREPKAVTRPAPTPAADDVAAHAHRYAACQQAMAAQIGPLRSRVRASLADGPPALAKLAELDGLMERALVVQERALLGTVAGRLAQRFQALRQAHPPANPSDPDAAPVATEILPGLDTFLQEMRALLLAELELRLQPVTGLLAAARPAPSSP